MSTEECKGVIRQFFSEVFNERNQDVARQLVSPTFVAHHPAFPGGIHGPDGILQNIATFRTGFPDLHYTLQDLIAEGDKVAVRWMAHGTHRGEFLHIPPTGKPVTVRGIDIFRTVNGKIEEAWVSSDFLGLLQQLGVIPVRGQA
jgi:steroid delta-isomerase-like uncharacterized protein